MRIYGTVLMILPMIAVAQSFRQEVETVAGRVEIVSDDTAGWRFDVECHDSSGRSVITVDLSRDTPAVPPRFRVDLIVPQKDIHYLWHPGDDNRCQLAPDWLRSYDTDIASGVPVYTFINSVNRNRLTMAAAEPFRMVRATAGVVEHGSKIHSALSFFEEPEAPIDSYHTAIMVDTRDSTWSDVVAETSAWIGRTCSLQAAPVPDAAFEPLYSTWYIYHKDVTDREIEEECRMAVNMGMKTIILDDGWQTCRNEGGYAYCGDWRVCDSKFPDMAGHVSRVRAGGMKYMIWYSVPFMGVYSDNFDRFKDKLLINQYNRGVLDPRFPEVREFICSTYERALREWNVDGFKLDFIDEFKFTGEDPAVAQGYAGRDFKSLPQATDSLMREVRHRLQAIRPDVLIEFRQQYIGPAIRQYGNMLRACDCPADMHSNRMRTVSLRLTSGDTAVHSDMLEWNLDETAEGAALNILSAIFSVIQYSMKLSTLPPDHRRMLEHWIGFTNRHRETLLRSQFRPLYPQCGYPVVEAESDDELIIAVYNAGNVVVVPEVSKPVYIINATGNDSVAIELAGKPVRAYVTDTYGNREEIGCAGPGITRVKIPRSGYLMLGVGS